jgi:hypothetical protein
MNRTPLTVSKTTTTLPLFFALGLCALLGSGNARAQMPNNPQPGILFLHLHLKQDAVTLVDSAWRPGILKKAREDKATGLLEYEALSETDTVLVSGRLEDPLWPRLEYEDPAEPGTLRSLSLQRDETEFTLRIAYQSNLRSICFYRSSSLLPGLRQPIAPRQFLGRVVVRDVTSEPVIQAASQATFQQLLSHGPKDKRMNIVFLSEGYTASDLSRFPADARKMLNYILQTPPYSEYTNYVNAYIISVASEESGSDHPLRGVYRNTYFNSTYDTYGMNRLLTVPSDGYSKAMSLLQTYIPEYDLPVVIVNDTEYGGSGGMPLIASINQASGEVAVHEMGHTFADLGDEYGDAYPGYPDTEEPNTTRETRRDFIKWKSWILESTPLPTPQTSAYGAVVGLFEGAHYHATGWYRPKLNCKMRSLDQPFCEVCKETEVLALYELVRPVESFSPASPSVSVTSEPVELNVSPMTPSTHSLAIQWYFDGETVQGSTTTVFTASSSLLPHGTHRVTVSVRDTTALVRTDTYQRLLSTNGWNLNISGETPVVTLNPPVPMGLPNALTGCLVSGHMPFNSHLQASTDLVNWTTLYTNKTMSAVQYIDLFAPAFNHRFYRVKPTAGP